MLSWSRARSILIRRAIIAAIMVLVFVQAFYHLATGGLPSFITEVMAGAALAICFLLSLGNTRQGQTWRVMTERGILTTVAVVILITGIYHGTHQGYYSGVLQPLAAGLLGFAAYLSFTAPSR